MDSVLQNLDTYGYLILFLYSLTGGQVGLIAAALMSASTKLDISWCILIAFLGNAIGTNLAFFIAKYYKKDFMVYIKKHKRKFALGKIKFQKYSVFFIFTHKYIYGLKTIIPVVAGMAMYNQSKFLVLNTFASLVWALSVGILFYYLGGIFSLELVKDKFENATNPYVMIPTMVCFFGLVYFYLSKASNTKKS